ncbi:MAG TPA: DNA repair protein RadA [Gemmatimonadota bacterium]|nr:DNA repair protein RadA [Gemmatimonadota bacterium]
MARARTLFFCLDCGAESVRWEGRCPSCGAWNTLAEAPAGAGGGSAGKGKRRGPAPSAPRSRPEPLGTPGEGTQRLSSGFEIVDRVLGGGLVPGSLLLLGGEPGIGKSTLLLQAAARVQAAGRSVLYASGEESRDQVRLRAERIGEGAVDLPFLATSDIDDVLEAAESGTAESGGPALLCIDSIQTVSTEEGGTPGGVSQVRACAARAQEFAKRTGTVVVLVGHVTKGGGLAGPRTLEHLVDVVLHFDGRRSAEFRLLRSTKNRFGSTDEVAAFRMTAAGLDPVLDPSGLFLDDRPAGASGSAVAVAMHGSQPILTEIQALTAPARYGSPQRMTTGFPSRRLAILLAVLERRAGVGLGDSDVFLSVVGGTRLTDPGADLAVLAALASSHLDRPIGAGTALIGEVGLSGELRGVSRPETRARAAVRAGLDDVVLPGVHRDGLAGVRGARFADHVREVVAELAS